MSLQIRWMTEGDLSFADALRASVGWNQTLQDWRRLLRLEPQGCFVAEWDGKPAGTATTTAYGTDLAWIGMVLVHEDCRRHGIGKALLNHCLATLQERKIRSIKLDATPLGKTLYDRLGFRDEWTFARWEISAGILPPMEIQGQVRPMQSSDWPEILKLDLEAFGVCREALVRLLVEQSSPVLVLEGPKGLTGFGMIRPGVKSDYLGPVVSRDSSTGLALVKSLLNGRTRPIFWDIPDANEDAVGLARKLGFTLQRPLIRMWLGENHAPGNPGLFFGIADPSCG